MESFIPIVWTIPPCLFLRTVDLIISQIPFLNFSLLSIHLLFYLRKAAKIFPFLVDCPLRPLVPAPFGLVVKRTVTNKKKTNKKNINIGHWQPLTPSPLLVDCPLKKKLFLRIPSRNLPAYGTKFTFRFILQIKQVICGKIDPCHPNS